MPDTKDIEPLIPLPDPAQYLRLKSFTEALKQAQTLSGLEDKELCGKGASDIINDTATWSRIKGGSHHFPQDKLVAFMRKCDNLIVLAWLAEQFGYMLRPKETELHKQLRLKDEQLRERELEIAVLRKLITGEKS